MQDCSHELYLQARTGWVSMLLLEWDGTHCNHPAKKDDVRLRKTKPVERLRNIFKRWRFSTNSTRDRAHSAYGSWVALANGIAIWAVCDCVWVTTSVADTIQCGVLCAGPRVVRLRQPETGQGLQHSAAHVHVGQEHFKSEQQHTPGLLPSLIALIGGALSTWWFRWLSVKFDLNYLRHVFERFGVDAACDGTASSDGLRIGLARCIAIHAALYCCWVATAATNSIYNRDGFVINGVLHISRTTLC